MPFAPDKIIINGNGLVGMDQAIYAEMESARHLGNEIVENKWEAETVSFRDELAKACDEHHAAEMKYYLYLRGLNQRMAAWIDKKLTPLP